LTKISRYCRIQEYQGALMRTIQDFIDMGYDYGNAAEAALAANEMEDSRNIAINNWLNNYSGDFHFYLSVKRQHQSGKALSEKQKEAIERAISRDEERSRVQFAAETEKMSPTFSNGTVLKISRGIAKAIAEQKSIPTPFRKVEIVKTHRETFKAIEVTVKFSSAVGHFCGICGRGLTHPVSQATGIGPECADKMGIARYSLEEANSIIEELSHKLNNYGEVRVWLPRSKIEEV
jgi:hypothetical protein